MRKQVHTFLKEKRSPLETHYEEPEFLGKLAYVRFLWPANLILFSWWLTKLKHSNGNWYSGRSALEHWASFSNASGGFRKPFGIHESFLIWDLFWTSEIFLRCAQMANLNGKWKDLPKKIQTFSFCITDVSCKMLHIQTSIVIYTYRLVL